MLAKNALAHTSNRSNLVVNKMSVGDRITLHAAKRGNPWINFSDGHDLPTIYTATEASQQILEKDQAQGLSLASADLDEDGVPDLISGYASPSGGFVTLHRGNVDSIFPNSPEAKKHRSEALSAVGDKSLSSDYSPSPFLPSAQVFDLPEAPDFLGAGDFDADGHWDVAAAARGSNKLYLLPGDGRGGFGASRAIELPGVVTALVTGEINRADGLTDIVVGIAGDAGAKALVFESPEGALRGKPEVFDLPAEAVALALGQLDDSYEMDVAVGAGSELMIIRGRDRKLSLDEIRQAEVKPAKISERSFPFPIKSVAIGDFTGRHESELALLSADGQVQVLGRADAKKRKSSDLKTWQVRSAMSVANSARLLIPARVSSRPADELVVTDSESHQLQIVTSGNETKPVIQSHTASPQPGVLGSLDGEGGPVAALPMRLNGDALSDLVIFQRGHITPTVVRTQATATFIVTNTNDSGPGSLRQAILDANANPGSDSIIFSMSLGAQTIAPASALPFISDPVTIDATTQPGFAGNPIIELNGESAGNLVVRGLIILSGSSTVRGLVINRFSGNGIELDGSGGSVIEGNFIGADASGTADLGNNGDGVSIFNSSNNTVGGTTTGARNVISGNNQRGILIQGDSFLPATGNQVQGNLIGTDVTGSIVLRNTFSGVDVFGQTGNSTVGGSTAGTRNIISGNNPGVSFTSTSGNIVQGNYIGTDLNGTADLGNSIGLSLDSFANNNTIGGTTGGARNIISGNDFSGIFIGQFFFFQGATGNLIQGNFIGTDATGTKRLGNGSTGLGGSGVGVFIGSINGQPSATSNNTVGGVVPGARNVISASVGGSFGNSADGVSISGQGADNNTVQGNFIGTDVTGTVSLGNGRFGVSIFSRASNNLVGGTATGAGNLVSGNGGHGVLVDGFNSPTTGNVIQGNFVGTDVTGTAKLSNNASGVVIQNGASGNLVGGPVAGARNVISGNNIQGVGISGNGNIVQGNFIGTDINGTSAIGNASSGVAVGGVGNTVGGTSLELRNLISGNTGHGVFISGAVSTANSVVGNYIGTDVNGTSAIGNTSSGVLISGAPGNTIGGTSTGARNIISGNNDAGVTIGGSGATGNLVQGNYIGTDSSGTVALGNHFEGVEVNAPNNMIGGTVPGAGNVVSGNFETGILISTGASDNVVQGNFVGADATGTADLGNRGDGILIVGSNNTIGGTSAAARNIISGNDSDGIGIIRFFSTNPPVTGNLVQGNFIGTDVSGTVAIGNGSSGVDIFGATLNTVGGTSVGARNVISGNAANGVLISSVSATGNLVQGNFIGTDVTGTQAIANFEGVFISGAPANTVGGTSASTRNVISGNRGAGALIAGAAATNNSVIGNFIGTDVTGTLGLGNGVGVTLNSAPNNVIGGTTPGAGNVISGNTGNGVSILNASATGNVVQGNFIGLDVFRSFPLGNANGVSISSAPGNTIGGTAVGASNTISANLLRGIIINGSAATGNFVQRNDIGGANGPLLLGNGREGVLITGLASNNMIGGPTFGTGNSIVSNGAAGVAVASGTGNAILFNFIALNAGLGIDLGPAGVTANDPGDADTGANGLQNFPVLNSVFSSGTSVSINGTLNSMPNSAFTLQFFSSFQCDDSGYGEGGAFIGATSVTTDGNGDASFNVTFPANPGFPVITATATDSSNNTSEFSQCLAVNSAVTPAGSNVTVQVGSVTINFTSVSSAGITSVIPISPAAAGMPPPGFVAVDNLAFDITTTATVTGPITLCFSVPSVNDPATFFALRILHNESGVLVDRTILPPDSPVPNFATRTICARVNSLSAFVIAQQLFNLCLQDDSNGNLLLINSTTGDYFFADCGANFTLSGKGTVRINGCAITLQDSSPDRRVNASVETCAKRGTAAIQVLSLGRTLTIIDKDTTNNTCFCP